MRVMVTGGAGYIGSHTAVELISAGHEVHIVDNFINSSPVSIERVEKIVGQTILLSEVDMCDHDTFAKVFEQYPFDAVIHFAGLKAVGESVAQPHLYYQNNLVSTLNLIDLMAKHNVRNMVFSSSATVYGSPSELPINENASLHATNPYGQTKLMIEQILNDMSVSDNDWRITALRYFNPIGAHKSGSIGEDPKGIPNNLLPYVSQVAAGRRERVSVFGNDYDTVDGTGVRDYIHVTDLAQAHVKSVEELPSRYTSFEAYNVGTGTGTSVIEIIDAMKSASGKEIPYVIEPRRPGDIASCYADVSKINSLLGWSAQLTVQDACRDSWNWQSQNPNGYVS